MPNVLYTIASIGTLFACCQGLVVADKEASTVRLDHITPHDRLLPPSSISDRPSLSTTNLVSRIFFSAGEPTQRGLSRLREIACAESIRQLQTPYIHQNPQQPSFYRIRFGELALFNNLRCAFTLEINQIVARLVEMEGDGTNYNDGMGDTPLAWAAWNGHEAVVKLLLGRDDIDPDKPGEESQTPLLLAACKGHEGVVEMLLGRDDINPNYSDERGRTPLWEAAHRGYKGIVKVLLGRDDINPDQPDKYGATPLCRAAFNRHEGVVKMLLERHDVNPNNTHGGGQTPLFWAAYYGDEGMAKILLGRDDINPDKPDSRGQTPLSVAAENGHEGVVRILLRRGDVIPDKPDKYGQTALSCAVGNGHARVIALLQSPASAAHRA